MKVGICVLVHDKDLMQKAKFKEFKDITLADFNIDPDIVKSASVITFRDYRFIKVGGKAGQGSRMKVIKEVQHLKSSYRNEQNLAEK